MDNQQLELLLKDLKDLYKKEKDLSLALQQEVLKREDPYESLETNKLAEAFAKAQGEYKVYDFNRSNTFFKSDYADLHLILQSTAAALAKYGLTFYQYTMENDKGQLIMISVLKHSSGQWISSRIRINPAKPDIQSLGGCMTYNKRYQAMQLLKISFGNDPIDDDGEDEMKEVRNKEGKGTSLDIQTSTNKGKSFETITDEQYQELNYELQEIPDFVESILTGLRIRTLADMPKNMFSSSMKRIREVKLLRKNGPEK